MKSFIEVNNCLKLYKEVSIKYFVFVCTDLPAWFSLQEFGSQKVMHVLGSTLADHYQKVCMYSIVLPL